ncbi:hypothetical protein RHRU231_470033 [Rhodococcus ruber]|uniref:Uncharacterized protein n=1 Tax=Rhodococcus ruber TaxID=1830 RepID=A0A098BLT8_9NOCA|nr:hypothetical protein RHRU231_470033 [Rhodococcus ruber]
MRFPCNTGSGDERVAGADRPWAYDELGFMRTGHGCDRPLTGVTVDDRAVAHRSRHQELL